MFRDLNGYYSGPEKPERPRNKLTPRQEKILLSVLIFNIIALVVAPIGGVSIIELFFAR
ncbi:hypothetical protein NCHU2750_12980 [Neorhizobium sp. NCHU2750]|nr:hypothetical protein NCHU2750_12980 [Neorhizobium sp. NCHU2750]